MKKEDAIHGKGNRRVGTGLEPLWAKWTIDIDGLEGLPGGNVLEGIGTRAARRMHVAGCQIERWIVGVAWERNTLLAQGKVAFTLDQGVEALLELLLRLDELVIGALGGCHCSLDLLDGCAQCVNSHVVEPVE